MCFGHCCIESGVEVCSNPPAQTFCSSPLSCAHKPNKRDLWRPLSPDVLRLQQMLKAKATLECLCSRRCCPVLRTSFRRLSLALRRQFNVQANCCAQHPGICHVVNGSTAYSLPRKPEGQPHTYNTDRLTSCLTSPLTYISNASRMCIITETRPIRTREDGLSYVYACKALCEALRLTDYVLYAP